MAHIQKHKLANGGGSGLIIEWLRTAKNYKNKNIDKSKANLNIFSDMNLRTNIQDLQNKNEGRTRDNLIALDTIVITLPKQLKDKPYKYQVKILEECNNFLCKKVNSKQVDKDLNLNAGYQMHFDESTPHLHSQFVPIDKKTNKAGEEYYGFAHKEIFDRQFYRTLHQELEEHMKSEFPELEQFKDLFVEEEIEEDKYLDEKGYSTGNKSHWDFKKHENKTRKELIKEIEKLQEQVEYLSQFEPATEETTEPKLKQPPLLSAEDHFGTQPTEIKASPIEM